MGTTEDAVLSRLKRNGDLSELGLDVMDGRVLVRNVSVPSTRIQGALRASAIPLSFVSGVTWFKRSKWDRLHFVNCSFREASFSRVVITGCLFEQCDFGESGFWESTIADTEFKKCNLRECALGGFSNPKTCESLNSFVNVKFEKCDLRGSAHTTEKFIGTCFQNCKLDGVNFNGAVFEDCQFIGRMEEVEFKNYDTSPAQNPRNTLKSCDFRQAQLVDCQFIKIPMDVRMLPQDDWIVLPNGPADLVRWQELLGKENVFINIQIEYVGAPTAFTRSELQRAHFSNEELDLLVKVGRGLR